MTDDNGLLENGENGGVEEPENGDNGNNNETPVEPPEEPEVRTSIVAPSEAADLLDYESPQDMPGKVMSVFVPAVDEFLTVSTGKRWSEDEPVDPLAKMVAGVLLVRWFEDPGQVGKVSDTSLVIFIGQLAAKAGG